MHADKKDEGVEYSKILKENLNKRSTLMPIVKKVSTSLFSSYDISLLIAKEGQSHTIREELIIPYLREVI